MSKVEKRIGLLYPAVYGDEVTILHTMTYTSDGRFRPECMETLPGSLDIFDIVEHLRMKQAGELPYDLFIVDTWKSDRGLIGAMLDNGLSVLSMQYMFEAIDKLVGGDLTKLEPGRPERKIAISASLRDKVNRDMWI